MKRIAVERSALRRIDWRRWSARATLLMMLAALGIVAHLLSRLSWSEIAASLSRIGPAQLAEAAACTAASYLVLTGFDQTGVVYAGARLPYRRVAFAAFLSLSIGHTVGFAPLSSGAIRCRYYMAAGLDLKQVGLIVLLSAVTVTLGETTLAGLALLPQPSLGAKLLHVPPPGVAAISAACLAVPILYAALSLVRRRSYRIGRWWFRMPAPRIAAAQIGLGLVNYGFVAGALYFVLPAAGAVDYGTVATAYVLGNLAALVTHVPGGLGVLETVIVVLLPGVDAIGPLIAFRIVYYLIPLAIGCLLFVTTELIQRRHAVKPEPAP